VNDNRDQIWDRDDPISLATKYGIRTFHPQNRGDRSISSLIISQPNTNLGLVLAAQIHPNTRCLEGIEVELKLNFISIPPKPRGLGWICVHLNKALGTLEPYVEERRKKTGQPTDIIGTLATIPLLCLI
jgi:hypothetical protein